MADSDFPRTPTQEAISERSVSTYVRDVPRSTIRIPGEALSILKAEAEKFRKTAEQTLADFEHQRPTATVRHARNNLLSLVGQAIHIAGIAVHQSNLVEAIIARIPDNLLADVSIYLDDQEGVSRVEREVVALVEFAGGVIVDAEEPVSGSWFRRMRALFAQATAPHVGQDALTLGAQAATSRLVNASNAQNTATLMQNLGPLLTSIERYENVVIRVQALLIVKVDGSLVVHQLTPAQQLTLDRNPDLARLPHDILPALGLSSHTTLNSSKLLAAERPTVRSESP
ncbi:hypothetical protein [Amycolatopsis sp. NPDC004378]